MASNDQGMVQQALPGYHVGAELGRGAFGIVYLAQHSQLGREVAVKQLGRAFAGDPGVRERFVAEARMVAGLDHPHIVPVFDFVDAADGQCLIIMERCSGSVGERFTSTGLESDEACAAILACLAALDFAHGAGVLHRDIKPENLLYDTKGVVKLGDFGIARALDTDARRTATGMVIGTPAYMSPEQIRGEDLTPASDVYSVGIMAYELLTGGFPFDEANSATSLLAHHLTTQPRPLTERRPELSPAIGAVIDRALSKTVDGRHGSALELGLELTAACVSAFGTGWLREGSHVLHWPEVIAASERQTAGGSRTATIMVQPDESRTVLAVNRGPDYNAPAPGMTPPGGVAAGSGGAPQPPPYGGAAPPPNPTGWQQQPGAPTGYQAPTGPGPTQAVPPPQPIPTPQPFATPTPTPSPTPTPTNYGHQPGTQGPGAAQPAGYGGAYSSGPHPFQGGPGTTGPTPSQPNRALWVLAGVGGLVLVAVIGLIAIGLAAGGDGGGDVASGDGTDTTSSSDSSTDSGSDTTLAPGTDGVSDGEGGNPDFTLPITPVPDQAVPVVADNAFTPTPCPNEPERVACLLAVAMDPETGEMIAAYESFGFIPELEPVDFHLHFYLDTVVAGDERKAGTAVPGGTWRSWDGILPFTTTGGENGRVGFSQADVVAAGARHLCVIVADPEQRAIPGTGNCAPIPWVWDDTVALEQVNRLLGPYAGRCAIGATVIMPETWQWVDLVATSPEEAARILRPGNVDVVTPIYQDFVNAGGLLLADGPVVDDYIVNFTVSRVEGNFTSLDTAAEVEAELARAQLFFDVTPTVKVFNGREVNSQVLVGDGFELTQYVVPDFGYALVLDFYSPDAGEWLAVSDSVAATLMGC